MKYIIVYGNPVDGFNFRGPFDTSGDASEYADRVEDDEIWWITELGARCVRSEPNRG